MKMDREVQWGMFAMFRQTMSDIKNADLKLNEADQKKLRDLNDRTVSPFWKADKMLTDMTLHESEGDNLNYVKEDYADTLKTLNEVALDLDDEDLKKFREATDKLVRGIELFDKNFRTEEYDGLTKMTETMKATLDRAAAPEAEQAQPVQAEDVMMAGLRKQVREKGTQPVGENLYITKNTYDTLARDTGSDEFMNLQEKLTQYAGRDSKGWTTELFTSSWEYLRRKDSNPWTSKGKQRVDAAAKIMAQTAIDILRDTPEDMAGDLEALDNFKKAVQVEILRNKTFRQTLMNELPEMLDQKPQVKGNNILESSIPFFCKFAGYADMLAEGKDAVVSGKIPTDDCGRFKDIAGKVDEIEGVIIANPGIFDQKISGKTPDQVREAFDMKTLDREEAMPERAPEEDVIGPVLEDAPEIQGIADVPEI